MDLIGINQRLKDIYLKYIESALPLRYDWMQQQRRKLLQQRHLLTDWPLVEPVPTYPSSGQTLAQVSHTLPGYEDLQALAGPLFPEAMPLYQHQVEALHKVLFEQKDLLVTTGTGSGKTETFLLPLLTYLAHESKKWPAMGPEDPERYWWRNPNVPYHPQWTHSRRTPGLRALILYPLNALVEDQLRRLRHTLDHPETHAWLDRARGGNRILFGRYTGLTPVPGRPNQPEKVQELRQYLSELEQQTLAIQADAQRAEDLRSHFHGLFGGEMWSRWDMQQHAPDILISNYSMLNIMLMRTIDQPLFEQTRAYLEQDPAHRFFLIVDELHNYRGTPGTEVAYLLRLFLHRLGLSPESEQLVIMATTASIDDTQASHAFLREFFGRQRFALLKNPDISLTVADTDLSDVAPQLAAFAQTLYPQALEPSAQAPFPERFSQALTHLLGPEQAYSDPAMALSEWLEQYQVREKFLKAIQKCQQGQIRATQVHHLDQVLFFPYQAAPSTISEALRGLLCALALAKTPQGTALQAVRGHLFFNKHHGLSICPNPACTDPSVADMPERNLGALHSNDRINCSCHARLLDLLVCQTCGEVFMGAYYK